MEIGEKIRKLRTDAGMTQDDLASRLAVTRTAVSKWETGKGWPGVDSLKLITDEFGVTIDALVSDEDVEQKRAVEHGRGLRYYWAAIACALAAMAHVWRHHRLRDIRLPVLEVLRARRHQADHRRANRRHTRCSA